MKKRHLCSVVAVALAALPGVSFAVTNVENNASVPFSFSNPGARSLGMGGAFIGLADDATAAYANPAGLTGIGLEKQVSFEFRHHSFDSEFASGGNATTQPLNLSGVDYDRSSSSVDNLSFLGFVLPRENWALAFYRHQFLDFRSAFSSNPIELDGGLTGTIFPVSARTDLDIVSYGASFGYNINSALSFGAGLSWYDFGIDTSAQRYALGGPQDASNVLNSQRQFGDDNDWGYNLGFLYRGDDNIQIGLSYRSAPSFSYRQTNTAGPANDFDGQLFADKRSRFKAPDTLGIGITWRASDALTISFDLNHVRYSNLSDGVDLAFFNDPSDPVTITFPDGSTAPFAASDFQVLAANRLHIENAMEPRLGMEYVFANMSTPMFLRLGTWHEPRHTLRFRGRAEAFEGTDAELDALANGVIFSTGDDEMHFSAGLGWAFESFSIDLAGDFSDRHDTLSLSGVWRF